MPAPEAEFGLQTAAEMCEDPPIRTLGNCDTSHIGDVFRGLVLQHFTSSAETALLSAGPPCAVDNLLPHLWGAATEEVSVPYDHLGDLGVRS